MMNKKEVGDDILKIFLKYFSQKGEILTNNKEEIGHKAPSCVFY